VRFFRFGSGNRSGPKAETTRKRGRPGPVARTVAQPGEHPLAPWFDMVDRRTGRLPESGVVQLSEGHAVDMSALPPRDDGNPRAWRSKKSRDSALGPNGNSIFGSDWR
jgi:hypothetical protein